MFPPLLPLLLTSAWVWVLTPDLTVMITELTDFSLEFLKRKMASARPRKDFIVTENMFRMNGVAPVFCCRTSFINWGDKTTGCKWGRSVSIFFSHSRLIHHFKFYSKHLVHTSRSQEIIIISSYRIFLSNDKKTPM